MHYRLFSMIDVSTRTSHSISIFFIIFIGRSICTFIPNDVLSLRIINETESERLASICGRSTESEPGGRRYPWAISIITSKGQNRLGGTIISSHHILTAAHGCIKFFFLSDSGWTAHRGERCQFNGFRSANSRMVAFGDDCIRVHTVRDFRETLRAELAARYRAGTHKLTYDGPSISIRSGICNASDAQINRIRAVYLDDGFLSGGCVDGHDWALIEVTEELRFTSPAVRPICLPDSDGALERDFARDPRLMIVGWGKPSVFAEGGPRIREIPMVHDPACRAPWSDAMTSNVADFICAKALNPSDESSPRTCHGDSGSGLEVRGPNGRAFLLGITSFGSKMCPSNELARFTRVSDYLHQICALTGVCYAR